MSELTLRQRERLEAITRRRHPAPQHQEVNRIVAMFVWSVALVLAAVWLAMWMQA